MIKVKDIKKNLSQIIALTEKNVKLRLRWKSSVVLNIGKPLIAVLMPLIVLNQLFSYNESFGPWTSETFVLFQFLAINIFLLKSIIVQFPLQLNLEKYWKTLPAIIVAPFNRFNLLFGIFTTNLILVALPFTIFLILALIVFPISIITFLFVLVLFFIIALIFSGIGLILGVFAISHEGILRTLTLTMEMVLWASCILYPYEIFPSYIQRIIDLNPLYYVFDFLRYTWIENDFILSINSHLFHFLILVSCAILFPCIGVYLFNYIFKKFGIVGY